MLSIDRATSKFVLLKMKDEDDDVHYYIVRVEDNKGKRVKEENIEYLKKATVVQFNKWAAQQDYREETQSGMSGLLYLIGGIALGAALF